MASGDMSRPRRVLPPLLLLLALPGVVPSIPMRDLMRGVMTEVIVEHCVAPGGVLASSLTASNTALRDLKAVVSEAVRENCPAPNPGADPQDPLWRSSCPSGFVPCAGRCYTILHSDVDYDQAERDCAAIGAHLAVPRSREQNYCVAALASSEDIWLGVTDRETEGVWRGADGRPIISVDGISWGPAQPDNAHGEEHCVHVIKNIGNGWLFGDWNDNQCTRHFFPMCQLPANAV